MKELKERIRRDGTVLNDTILKVDSIINHQVDARLMAAAGQEIARRFSNEQITRILTAEVSGLSPALMTAYELDVPMVYARKRKSITMTEPVYVASAPSPTKGGEVLLMVSPDYIGPDDRILIVDDFLASGKTLYALVEVARQAGARVVGIATLVEKTFQDGRGFLAEFDLRIESLVTITAMSSEGIVFGDD